MAELFQQQGDLPKTSSHYTEAQRIVEKMTSTGVLALDDYWISDELAGRVSAIKLRDSVPQVYCGALIIYQPVVGRRDVN